MKNKSFIINGWLDGVNSWLGRKVLGGARMFSNFPIIRFNNYRLTRLSFNKGKFQFTFSSKRWQNSFQNGTITSVIKPRRSLVATHNSFSLHCLIFRYEHIKMFDTSSYYFDPKSSNPWWHNWNYLPVRMC